MSSTVAHSAPAPAQEVVPAPAVAVREGRFALRRAHLWAIIPLAVAWFAAGIDRIEPFDFWWNVKSGEIMMQTGRFLGTDVLVWSPVREPYSNPQWGSQLLFYWVYSLSPYLLLTLRAVIITATVGLLMWLCGWRAGGLRAGVFATLVAYFAAWTNYGMRPQLFAFIPFVAFLLLLERKDAHPKWLPLLVPIMLFWVNVHGSFFLGVAMLGIYALGSVIERLGTGEGRAWLRSKAALWQAGWFVAAALTSLLNPYFAGIYSYFLAATNDPIARSLNIEWQPPTLYDGTGQLFYVQVAVLLVSLYLSRRRLRPTEILIVLAFGYLALTSLRNVMWWGWVTAPMMAANFAAWGRLREQRRLEREAKAEVVAVESAANKEPAPPTRTEIPALNWLLAGLFVGWALLFTPIWRTANPLVPAASRGALADSTPSKIAEYVKANRPPAPLFNYMEWGGYLEWELYPTYQLFIDGRFEARQVQVWKDYLAISRGRANWQKTLDTYGVRTLILSKDFHNDLIPFVQESAQWHKAYEDKQGIVFTR